MRLMIVAVCAQLPRGGILSTHAVARALLGRNCVRGACVLSQSDAFFIVDRHRRCGFFHFHFFKNIFIIKRVCWARQDNCDTPITRYSNGAKIYFLLCWESFFKTYQRAKIYTYIYIYM